ncbi:MAG: isoleucine--tRNA ligase [Deferribacteraceae bacterium]|jgi:isoleucyl-tRNA synthetase|nr:isoleucine--tRNA ligase [Deferribacteraceae bacterium]
MDYKSTLNLPKTAFPMKAGLAEQEPLRVARWQAGDLYHKVLAKRAIDKSAGSATKSYVLHDGPPYANNNIHIGTAMNKILKDFVVKSKLGFGFYSPYIPGWDCHGLPIEHKVDKELGEKKAQMSKNDIRKLCREYAAHWLDVQRESFKRLGVSGDWDKPYITMDYAYEAITLAEFYKVLKSGNLYKGLKPVYWCADCATALAEAEIEYADHVSHSIFVKFAFTEDSLAKLGMQEQLSAVIWTTTPWTLPANLGISVHPDETYSVMRIDETESANLKAGELIMVAQPLLSEDGIEGAPLREKLKITKWTEEKTFPASALDRLEAIHPFYPDRRSLLMLGDHVLMTDGTGLVHTAPGHGQEDYVISMKYGLPVYNPVDDYGKFVKDLPIFGGKKITDANKDIVEHIRANGSLIADGKIKHSYPHCWRCKNPVIYRATPQWFISMETNDLRKKALDAIENKVQWLPAWGANRIRSMVEGRPDWCVSRQRAWGVPIALFTCRDCGEIIFDDTIEKKVLDSFKEMGADAWFEHDVAYYLGKDAKCPHCGSADIKQETDILDVWFDSGTSHAAVCEARPEIGGRADMYLEGTDQHRGWFQSSLLESVVTRGEAPYRDVLTHGFVMDMEKKKVSKSLGNYIAIEELVKNHGAEVLRLWVAGADYTNDVSISQDILKRLVESYRKIRNTMRYLLGSIPDFSPDTDTLPFEQLMELDKYILLRWQDVKKRVYKAYEDYQFHIFYHSLMDFCINELSALYMDVIKDRIYSYAPASRERRSAQTAMFTLAKEMAVVMSPVLSFTADEVWEYLPAWGGKSEFVFEELFPAAEQYNDNALESKFDKLLHVRKAANKALELSRAAKVIGHPLDAKVLIGVKAALPELDEGLSRFLIVSEVEVLDFTKVDGGTVNDEGDVTVLVSPSEAAKCARCWTHDHSVGKSAEHPELCERCAQVVAEL